MSASDPRDQGVATFLQEAGELLQQVETAALALEERQGDRELINQLFRAFHTLKGSGAMVGFDAVSSFTHHVESALARVRSGGTHDGAQLVSLLLSAKDYIEALLDAQTSGSAVSQATAERLVAELSAICRSDTTANPVANPPLPQLVLVQPLASNDGGPTPDEMDDMFIIVEPTGIRYEPIASTPPPQPTHAALPRALLPVRETTRPKSAAMASRVYVPSERLDRFVKLVAELVINQTRLSHALVLSGRSHELAGLVEAMDRLSAALRDSVFGTRMIPIGGSFGRLQRLVHDLSAELGKELDLVTEGDETELADAVLDDLMAPLIQLIRNSVQHGIEPSAERLALGKPRRGTLSLRAQREGNHVLITLQDDGRGLNPATLRAQAEGRGLLDASAHLSEQQNLDLIFLLSASRPANAVGAADGGMGLDGVKRTIEGLGGAMRFSSRSGEGTTFSLELPLSLPIIDGLLVEVAGDRLIIPTAELLESVVLLRSERLARDGRDLVVRGERMPYVRLRDLFDQPEGDNDFEKVVIVACDTGRIGVVVDRVVGRLACGAGLAPTQPAPSAFQLVADS